MTTDDPRPLDEATWRNRFILMNLVRIGGTIVVLIGLAIWHSDWIEQGGAIENEFRTQGPKPAAFCSDPFGNGFCVIGER